MVEVSARVDDDYMTLHFPSIEDAINYVSFEYEYYSKLHVDTERFNVADTQDAPSINICEDVLDRDPHCEPYSKELRFAFIDAWDVYVEWTIREIN